MFSVGFDTSALDESFKSHAHRGIGRYVRELAAYFNRQSSAAASSSANEVQVGYFNHTSFVSGRIARPLLKALPAGVNTVRQQILFPLQLSTGVTAPFNCVHFPAHMDAPAWSIKPCIITVLDLIPLILKDLYLPERGNLRFHFARWLEIRAIRSAKLIIAISDTTKQDLVRVLGIAPERIMVTPLGVDARFHAATLQCSEAQIRARYGIPNGRPIILYVGGIDQRKNYRALIETLRRLVSNPAPGQGAPVLVMAGNIAGDRQFPKLKALIADAKLDDSVILPGFIPDHDLLQLYPISSVFFFPSLYEGFGLPPLEAMAAGVPVVSSNTSCMPEVLGDAAVCVDPLDYDAAAQEMYGLLTDPQRRMLLKERGKERAAQFTWERTGELTMQAYERLARERTSPHP